MPNIIEANLVAEGKKFAIVVSRFNDFITDKLVGGAVDALTRSGTKEKDIDIVIMGTQGTSGDLKNIFFGSTTERVLRFIKRPVLCVPIEEDRKE